MVQLICNNITYWNDLKNANSNEKVTYYEEEKQNIINTCAVWTEKETISYVESPGNCEYIYLPGCHSIYEQKPEDVSEILKESIGRPD